MRRKYTDEVFEYAQKLREEGLSIKEISEITNIGMPVLSKNTVPNEKAKAAQKRIKMEQREIKRNKLIKLVENNSSKVKIAEEFGIKVSSVPDFGRRLDVKLTYFGMEDRRRRKKANGSKNGDIQPGSKVEFLQGKKKFSGVVCDRANPSKTTYIIDCAIGRKAINKKLVREVTV